MAKFVFQLDGLLRQREREEQERQRDVALKAADLVFLEEELRRLDASAIETLRDVRENHLVGKLDLAFIAAHRRFMLVMQRQATDLASKIAAQQQVVDEARLLLLEAAKRRKAVEKLRERQLERWKLDVARREQAQQDEIGVQLGAGRGAFESDDATA